MHKLKEIIERIALIFVVNLIGLSSSFVSKVSATTGAPLPACDGQITDLGCIPSDPILFVEKFYSIGLWLIGFVGVLFMIIGGYLVMTSRGDVSQLQKGKSYIIYAILGLILAIFGFVFIEILAGQVLVIPGFG